MERILYILGSICHTTKYIQGFNELLAPLYCVLLRAESLFDGDDEVEAVAFHLLHALLTQTRLSELFTTQDSSSVLLHRLAQFESLVDRHVPAVADVIRHFRIHPMCYAFRWFSLLFAQDHEFDEVIGLWDEAFERIDAIMDFILYVGVGHLRQMEGKLNLKSSSETMKVLQKARDCDLKEAMRIALELWNRDCEEEKKEWNSWREALVSYASLLWGFWSPKA
jgi:hypothetical protein